MKLKNISIRYKIWTISTVLCALLIFVGVFAMIGMKHEEEETAKIEHLFELDVQFLKRELDLLTWASAVSNFILDHSTQSLTVEKDHTQSKFGKWINDKELINDLEHIDPKLVAIIEEMRAPHEQLYRSAAAIEKAFINNGSNHTAATGPMLAIYKTQTLSSLKKIKESFHQISENLKNHVKEEEERLHHISVTTKRNIVIAIVASLLIGSFLIFSFPEKSSANLFNPHNSQEGLPTEISPNSWRLTRKMKLALWQRASII